MCLTEPITSPRFFLKGRCICSTRKWARRRRERWQFFLPLYSGHSVWWFLQRGGSDCYSAGGDSSVWNFIFSTPSDHFILDNIQSFLCIIYVFSNHFKPAVPCMSSLWHRRSVVRLHCSNTADEKRKWQWQREMIYIAAVLSHHSSKYMRLFFSFLFQMFRCIDCEIRCLCFILRVFFLRLGREWGAWWQA